MLGNYSSCEEECNLKKKNKNMEIATIFLSIVFRVTHNRSIGIS